MKRFLILGRIQTELAFTLAKNDSKPNPVEFIPLQTTRKENNWKTEETLERTVLTLETERIKLVQSLMFMMMMMIGLRFQAQIFTFLKASASVDTGKSFPRIERPECEADHKNDCKYNFTPPTCLRGLYRGC